MTNWMPISEEGIWDEINESQERMTPEQMRFWDLIKMLPRKWGLDPWGNEGGGFWVVGQIGQFVIWYNDIEEGFNRSRFSEAGRIDEYWCNQDELEWVVQSFINQFRDGYDSATYAGPPQPGPYQG